MAYCPDCGEQVHSCAPSEAGTEAKAVRQMSEAEIEIARINARRDVTLAKIAAGQTDAEVEGDLAVAEVLAETVVAEAAAEEEQAEEASPVVIVDSGSGEPAADPDAELAPPPAEHHHHEEKERGSAGYGSSAWFGGGR
jgi:predicted  nucleic acid-binding Zn-ribbon protein